MTTRNNISFVRDYCLTLIAERHSFMEAPFNNSQSPSTPLTTSSPTTSSPTLPSLSPPRIQPASNKCQDLRTKRPSALLFTPPPSAPSPSLPSLSPPRIRPASNKCQDLRTRVLNSTKSPQSRRSNRIKQAKTVTQQALSSKRATPQTLSRKRSKEIPRKSATPGEIIVPAENRPRSSNITAAPTLTSTTTTDTADTINTPQATTSNYQLPAVNNKKHSAVSSSPDKDFCPCKERAKGDFTGAFIQCDQCEQWWHSKCVGLSGTQTKLFEKHAITYKCVICIASDLRHHPEIAKRIEEKLNEPANTQPAQKRKRSTVNSPLRPTTDPSSSTTAENTTSNLTKTPSTTSNILAPPHSSLIPNLTTAPSPTTSPAPQPSINNPTEPSENIIIIDNCTGPTNTANSIKATLKHADNSLDIAYNYSLSKGGFAFHLKDKDNAAKAIEAAKKALPTATVTRPRSPKTKKVIIRGISTNIPSSIIQSITTKLLKSPTTIHRFTDRASKKPFPIVSLETSTDIANTLLQQGIQLLDRNYTCEPHYKSPTRCFNCQKFGHIKANCIKKTTCQTCAEDHNSTKCTASHNKCANCNLDHPAHSKLCPTYNSIFRKINNGRLPPHTPTQHPITPIVASVPSLSTAGNQC